jgi:hypothetical protein
MGRPVPPGCGANPGPPRSAGFAPWAEIGSYFVAGLDFGTTKPLGQRPTRFLV